MTLVVLDYRNGQVHYFDKVPDYESAENFIEENYNEDEVAWMIGESIRTIHFHKLNIKRNGNK